MHYEINDFYKRESLSPTPPTAYIADYQLVTRLPGLVLILLAFLSMFAITSHAQIQQKIWYFNGKAVDFTTSTPSVFNLPADYGTNEPVGATNGVYGIDGTLIFYVIDGKVFNKNGQVVTGLFVSNSYSGSVNNSELQIVQIPGECSKYYIIYFEVGIDIPMYDYVALRYSIFDLTLNNGLGDIVANGTLIDEFQYDQVGSTAIGKIRENNTRLLYYGYGRYFSHVDVGLYKFIISNTGISLNQSFTLNDVPGVLYNYELELSHDQSLLAFGSSGSEIGYSGSKYVYFIHLDEHGNVDTNLGNDGTTKVELVENENRLINGMEFSPNSELLFVSSPGYGVYWIDIANNFTPSSSVISGSSSLGYSQLELAYNGYIYAASDQRYLYPIDIDANPPVVITNEAIDLGSNAIIKNTSVHHIGIYTYTLPDQIDGENYDFQFEGISLNCCTDLHSYHQIAYYSLPGGDTWTENGNPLNNSTGNFAFIRDTLFISAGSTITIQNMELHFAPDAVVIIEAKNGSTPAGKLILDDTKFTLDNRCEPEQFWKGIQVWGHSNLNQWNAANQGHLELINGAIIEYSKDAVSLIKFGDINSTGGIVKARDSYFRNNKRSVQFMQYKNFLSNPNTEHDNLSSFINTTFIVDTDFLEGQNFGTHVTMWAVRGVKFYGCRFMNEMTNGLYDEVHNKGIYSIDAGYFIHAYCNDPGAYTPPCAQQYFIPSKFRGFSYGVQATTTGSIRTVSIDQTIFTENFFGVWMDKQDGFRVVRSQFEIGESDLENINSNLEQKGLFSLKNSRFTIEDNMFEGTQNENYSKGLRIDDTDAVSTRSYNNHFIHLYVGQNLRGYNRDKNNAYVGYQSLCNRHHENQESEHKHDIWVEEGDAGSDAGILLYQGNSLILSSSGNTFSHTNTNSYSDVFNDVDWGLIFFHTGSNTEPIYVNGNVAKTFVDNGHACKSNFVSEGFTYDVKYNIFSNSKRNDLLNSFDSLELEFAYLLYNYHQLIDGGSTSDLVAQVQSTWPQEAWDLHDDLMSQSPFLSNEVLIETIDQDVLPHALYLEVCLANPDATSRDEAFLYYIEFDAGNPLPNYMVELIRANSDSITARTMMEVELAEQYAQMSFISNLLISDFQLDTVSNFSDIRYWLQRRNQLPDRYALIETFLEEGEFQLAFDAYSDIDIDFDLRDDWEDAYNDYGDYLALWEQLPGSDNTWLDLDVNQLNDLEHMAMEHKGYSQRYAANILCFFYQNCQYIPIEDPQHSSRPQVNQNQLVPEVPEELHLFRIYPNPAGNYTSIAWEIEEILSQTFLEVFDITGKVMTSYKVNSTLGEWAIDTRNFPNGMYTCRLIANGKVLQSKSLMIKK